MWRKKKKEERKQRVRKQHKGSKKGWRQVLWKEGEEEWWRRKQHESSPTIQKAFKSSRGSRLSLSPVRSSELLNRGNGLPAPAAGLSQHHCTKTPSASFHSSLRLRHRKLGCVGVRPRGRKGSHGAAKFRFLLLGWKTTKLLDEDNLCYSSVRLAGHINMNLTLKTTPEERGDHVHFSCTETPLKHHQ